MPSIPQSLLWISLVVLWLFVLVPMLINKRDVVRRTSDIALATRVLNSSRAARLLRRTGPAAGHRSDPHWRPAADDEVEDFDEEETGPVVVTGRPTRGRSMAMVTSLAQESEQDYLDVDVVEEGSGALPVAEDPEPEELRLDFETADTAAQPEAVAQDVAEDVAAAGVVQQDQQADGTADEYEYIDDTSGLEPEAEDPVPLVSRSSRLHATKTAAAVSARKYRFRTRALLTMAVTLVVAAVTAFLVTPAAWYLCAGLAVVTLLYLGYLRRQTRIEERLRRRRVQRMARARFGVENASDDELDIVPSRLRRPGAAVLEIDDEDPVFEHLEYASFAREFHLPHAAGQ